MFRSFPRSLTFLVLVLVIGFPQISQAQHSVLTQHNDLDRTGWNDHETLLTQSKVRPGSFGKAFSRTVDDQIYAQPLVVSGVNIPGKGLRNVVFVGTVNNSLYAFDADSAEVAAPYWQVNLSPAGTRAVKNTDMTGACGGGYRDFSGNMGIVGTPVIDPATQTLYVVARSVDLATGNAYAQYLHAIDIATGAERPNSPRLITAQVAGNGDGSVGGVVYFDPQKQNQRPGLLLLGNRIYLAWASHCDWGPYHGWIMGYEKTSLVQEIVYNTTPEGYNGGIWMSGSGLSADTAGNIYAAVGNGSIGLNNNPANLINRSESALKLTPNGNRLVVSSFFTPDNIADLEAADLDFGVTAVLLLPGTNRALTACKDGRIYVLNRDDMGGYNPTTNNVVQTIDLGVNAHLRSALAYYRGENKTFVYSWSENALLKAFPFNQVTQQFDLNQTISSGAQGPTGNNGAFMSVSSNGSVDSTAILWVSHAANGDANQSVRPGILRAFDANDVTRELWNSAQYAADNPGTYAKFNCPTICNGKVYLATFSNQLVVYGVSNSQINDTCSTTNIALGSTISVSSTAAGYAASLAIDGDTTTQWLSQAGDPQFVQLDLGKRYDLCRVELRWKNGMAKAFQVQTGEDGITWQTQITLTANGFDFNYLPLQTSCRFVRIFATEAGANGRYGLAELSVFGSESAKQCPEPGGLHVTNIYPNSATLNWNGNGGSSFLLDYKTVSAGAWNTVMLDTTAYVLQGLACANDYLYRLRGICSGTDTSGFSVSASFSTLGCNVNCGPLPTRWSTQDIGDVDAAGSACYENGVFTLQGAGADIWGAEDGFRFAYKTFVGNGELQARVLAIDPTNAWNKCGLMFRESLTPGSRHAFLALTTGNGVAYQGRAVSDGESQNANTGPGIVAPYWLRLVKQGSMYTAYASADNIAWTQIGDPFNPGFGEGVPVYAGLALTSHELGLLATATLDHVALTGVLQVELIDFTASLGLNKVVNLQWITTLENNLLEFVVERSSDNLNYADLDTIPAVSQGRFTQTYNDVDPSPQLGYNYYRLRIVNREGQVNYSAPVFVVLIDGDAPRVFPNPAAGVVHLAQGAEPIVSATLIDLSGRILLRVDQQTGFDMPVTNIANGLYVVEIKTATSVFQDKLIIRN